MRTDKDPCGICGLYVRKAHGRPPALFLGSFVNFRKVYKGRSVRIVDILAEGVLYLLHKRAKENVRLRTIKVTHFSAY